MTNPEQSPEPSTEPSSAATTEIDPAEALVEEVSIDGMCGVY